MLNDIDKIIAKLQKRKPGQSECEEAKLSVTGLLKSIDEAAMNGFTDYEEMASIESGHQKFTIAAKQTLKELNETVEVANNDTQKIGGKVKDLIKFFDPLLNGSLRLAAQAPNQRSKDQILGNTRTAAENMISFVDNTSKIDPDDIMTRVTLLEKKALIRTFTSDKNARDIVVLLKQILSILSSIVL